VEGSHVISLAVSPDSKLLLASAWGKRVETKLPDGRVRSSTAREQPVSVWDLATGKRLQQVFVTDERLGAAAFSADGKLFAAASGRVSGRIRFWDLATGRERRVIGGFDGVARVLAFSPDGKRLVAGMSDTSALVWDLTDLPTQKENPP
jgi:WD40 repeat protein